MTIISQAIYNSLSKCALIPFITAGDPSLNITKKAIIAFDNVGADIIELGLPYSVPLADGPIIQTASNRALAKHINFDKVLDLIETVNKNIKTPIILFTYYNPIFSRGVFIFIQNIARAGIQGLLVPDLPLEESDYIIYLCHQFNIELIFLLAPTSTLTRVKNIVSKTSGCIYLVSKTGVTGTPSDIQTRVKILVTNVKSITHRPLILGFGISNLKQIDNLCTTLEIEGLVLGSVFVKTLSEEAEERGIAKISQFCQRIKEITHV